MKQTNKGLILIVDDIPANIGFVVRALTQEGYEVRVAESGVSALEQLEHERPDLILLDILMPGIDGYTTCRRIKADKATRNIPIIFMTALSEEQDIIRGFETGAIDYVSKPIRKEELLARVRSHVHLSRYEAMLEDRTALLEDVVQERTKELERALQKIQDYQEKLQDENTYLKQELRRNFNNDELIANDPKFQEVLVMVADVAPTDATVLITGETGTGKELVARAVHANSTRANQTMISINCAALPAELMESELFGHEKGAFTGAVKDKPGRFELADKGTIFLDEIGEMPMSLQAKLLRVLQSGTFERLGGTKTLQVDVRVVAATNRNLPKAIQKGLFREDLFYRLNVVPIAIPPLRERPQDVDVLIDHFLRKFSSKIGKQITTIKADSLDRLRAYAYPGNIRELENIIERGVILNRGTALDLGAWFKTQSELETHSTLAEEPILSLEENERRHIVCALEQTNWKVSGAHGAAELLQINGKTLQSKIKKLGIQRPGQKK